jgi:DNA repair photolyase
MSTWIDQLPSVREINAVSILTPQKVGSLSRYYDFTLNPYGGCAFGCSYCYVPKFPNARHEPAEWGQWVEVKVNAAELIRKERARVFGSCIFFSSATDPYQYLELKYRLTRACLQELLAYSPAQITMHTRSHLMLTDLELLKAFGKKLSVGVSFTTDDEGVRQEFEPQAPSLKRRLELITRLKEAGIDVYASISPLLPCDPQRLVGLLSPYIDRAWVDAMRWIDVNTKPQLLAKYKDFFEPANHERVVAQIDMAFPHKRPRLMEEELSFADHSKSAEIGKTKPSNNFDSGKTTERSKQMKLPLV